MTNPKSLKSVRSEFHDKGIFYTPPELAKALLKYVDVKPNSVYDPTCGSGNLLSVFDDSVDKYGQELDPEQLGICYDTMKGFHGYAGDTLTDDGFKGRVFDCIMANPPFSIKWNSKNVAADDERFNTCPVLPPDGKADWAFLLHIINHLSDDGVAVVLGFPGILYRGNREAKVREWFVRNNYIDRVVHIPGNTFEDTAIATCVLVLRKNKSTTDITFEDTELGESVTVSFCDVEKNKFNLSVSSYITKPDTRPVYTQADLDDMGKTACDALLKRVRANFDFEKLSSSIGGVDHSDYLAKGLKSILSQYGY